MVGPRCLRAYVHTGLQRPCRALRSGTVLFPGLCCDCQGLLPSQLWVSPKLPTLSIDAKWKLCCFKALTSKEKPTTRSFEVWACSVRSPDHMQVARRTKTHTEQGHLPAEIQAQAGKSKGSTRKSLGGPAQGQEVQWRERWLPCCSGTETRLPV